MNAVAAAASWAPRLGAAMRTFFTEDAALETHASGGMFNVIDSDSGWKVDLIHCRDRPFSREEFARRVAIVLDESPLAVATLEDVILSKLEWAHRGGSRRQLEDVATLIRVRRGDLDRAYVDRWVTELGVETEWAEVAHALERDEQSTCCRSSRARFRLRPLTYNNPLTHPPSTATLCAVT